MLSTTLLTSFPKKQPIEGSNRTALLIPGQVNYFHQEILQQSKEKEVVTAGQIKLQHQTKQPHQSMMILL
jgi:hypothetical protein